MSNKKIEKVQKEPKKKNDNNKKVLKDAKKSQKVEFYYNVATFGRKFVSRHT